MRSLPRSMGLGILTLALASLLVSLLEPLPGEPLWIRWLRTLVEHPLRGALGLGLLHWALGSDARAFESPNSGPTQSLGTGPDENSPESLFEGPVR